MCITTNFINHRRTLYDKSSAITQNSMRCSSVANGDHARDVFTFKNSLTSQLKPCQYFEAHDKTVIAYQFHNVLEMIFINFQQRFNFFLSLDGKQVTGALVI